MPSTTIDATLQGIANTTVTGAAVAWVSQVRNASTAGTVNTYTSNTSNVYAIRASLTTGRGGYAGICARTFLFFDVSSITGTITAATLKVLGAGFSTNADTIVTEATAWGGDGTTTTLSTSDYSNLNFGLSYSSELTSWSPFLYNDFSLNSSAISAMNTDGYLNCAVIDHDHDYSGVSPTLETVYSAGIEFLDPTSKIKLEITYSTGYGNTVMGVVSANIGEVTGVATADIGKVIGVQ